MAEPDNLVLELLREIRADVQEIRVELRALTERVDTLEIKLDGLTHAVIAGFGSVVHELNDLKQRVGRLETERA